jgi:hypothetical protein
LVQIDVSRRQSWRRDKSWWLWRWWDRWRRWRRWWKPEEARLPLLDHVGLEIEVVVEVEVAMAKKVAAF